MVETSLKDQVKKLVELQKIDAEIYELKVQLREKPLVIEELKNQFEESKATLNELEEKSKATQVARKEFDLELQQKEDLLTKANGDLSAIKTNKEYTAKLKEMESIKADKSIIEEKILISYDEEDQIKADIEKEKTNVAEQEKVYLAKKKEVEEEVVVIEDRTKVLEAQREPAKADVDPTHLHRYNMILENKQGQAIVPVENDSCGGCFMNVTSQVINELKMYSEMVYCDQCARILYIEDAL